MPQQQQAPDLSDLGAVPVDQAPAGGTAGAAPDLSDLGAVPVDQTPSPSQPQPSLGQQALQQGQDFFTQAEKGILGSVQSVSELINKIPKIGQVLMPTAAVQAGRQAIQQMGPATTIGGKAGAGAEDIAEFIAGDEALKGLALGDKLLQVGKVADYYENASGFTKAAIEHGMNIMRQSALGAGLGGIKGGQQGAEAGAIGGAAIEPVGAVAGKVSEAASSLWNTVTGKAIQTSLQDGIFSTATQAADDAGVEIAEPSIRNTFRSLADGVEKQSKAMYRQIDDATNGEFTNLQNKIRNVEQKTLEIAGTDDALEEKLFNQKVSLNVKLDEAIEAAQKAGVDPGVADQARAAWKQQSALRDLDTAVKGATEGDIKHAPEVVDPNKLVTRLQKLEDSGRLTEAIGAHGDDLLTHAYDAKQAVKSRATKFRVAKRVGIGGGALAGGARLIEELGGQQ